MHTTSPRSGALCRKPRHSGHSSLLRLLLEDRSGNRPAGAGVRAEGHCPAPVPSGGSIGIVLTSKTSLRLLQERGFDIEDMGLRNMARLEQLMAVVWMAGQFLWHLSLTLPKEAQQWLRWLGGKLHSDRGTNGLYFLLYGLSALLTAYLVRLLRANYPKAALRDLSP